MNKCIKVESNNITEISMGRYSALEQRRYNNRYKKILFFLFNEGVSRTTEKICSIMAEQALKNEQKLIACRFYLNGTDCVGIGRQLFNDKYKKFNSRLVFKVKDSSRFELNKLKFDDHVLLKLASFIPVDECPLDDNLPNEITALNRDLESFDFEISGDYLWKPEKNIKQSSKRIFIYGFGAYAHSYSSKFFMGNVNSIVDCNKRVLTGFRGMDKISYFEDYRDSLPLYAKIDDPVAVISTYHSAHFKIAKELFLANPKGKVFIEKPVVVRFQDASELIDLKKQGFWLDAGYNRRYIDWNIMIMRMLKTIKSPKIINISVKETIIPPMHWYYWPNQGTRITGNLCHWIDLAYFWVKSKPREMTLLGTEDSFGLSILFEDGSIANITASDKGNDLRGVQEKIEVRAEDRTIFIDDYKKMTMFNNGSSVVKKKILRDKGHDAMYRRFLKAAGSSEQPLYAEDDLFWVSYMTDKAAQMFVENKRHVKVKV